MIVATFDPTAKTTDAFNTNLPIGGKFLLVNQSNVNLSLKFADGSTAYAPAWQITPFKTPTPVPKVTWAQQTILTASSTPISQVTIDAYQPNEQLMGTYPVAIQHTAYIPNQVSTSAVVNSLSNEGNGVGTEYIDGGTVANPKLLDIFNDHFVWSVEQSGVAHIVLTGRTTGKPLLLGQVGDHTEVAGTLDVDSNFYVVGSSTFDNGSASSDGSGNLSAKTLSTSSFIFSTSGSIGGGGLLYSTQAAGTALSIKAASSLDNGKIVTDGSGKITTPGTIINTDGSIVASGTNNIGLGTGGTGRNVFDTSSSDTWIKAGSAAHVQVPNGTNIITCNTNGLQLNQGNIIFLNNGQFARINGARGTSCGSNTTISHGIGVTPTAFIANPQSDAQPASATIGVGNFGSTTVACTIGALSLITWWSFF